MKAKYRNGSQRFDALLAGSSAAPYDQPLMQNEGWLVVPTLGSIIPNWVLAVPRRRVLSFRDWAAGQEVSVEEVLSEIREQLGLQTDEIIWFEHGPASAGSVIGCGLDHAHLHILIHPPFDFAEFADCARASANLSWCEVKSAESYSCLQGSSSYCVAGCGDRAIYATDVEDAGSQFFRRVVAKLVQHTDWDYRHFAHSNNVETTIVEFERLKRAAKIER